MSINITAKTDQLSAAASGVDGILDRDWLKTTFLLSDAEIAGSNEYIRWIRKNRYVSSADFKFTATSPGMNMSVNAKPSFTRYADIRSKGRVHSRKERISVDPSESSFSYGLGMGRYYSEAIDDTAQRVFFRFGVPNFTPLAFWVHQAFDIDRAILANRGGLSSAILQTIDFISAIFVIKAFPLISLGAFVLGALVTETRFYTVKPTMYLYWSTVEDILNMLISRRTLLPHILTNYVTRTDNRIGQAETVTADMVSELNRLIPDIVDSKGRISVFGLALKAQAVFNTMKFRDYEQTKEKNISTDFTNFPINEGLDPRDSYFTNSEGEPGLFTRFIFNNAVNLLNLGDVFRGTGTATAPTQRDLIGFNPEYTDNNNNPLNVNLDPNNPQDTIESRLDANRETRATFWENYRKYSLAELNDGAAFAIFSVDFTGSVGESFSSSFSSNPIESTFNSISAKARTVTNMIGGAGDLPVIGDAFKLALDAGATILSNATFGVANPILALMYGLNVELPRIWETSSASLPRGNYKMKLIAPYGNAYSQLFNIYLPLAMILAGSLPRSTGSASHTSPFLCQVFDRGRLNINLGMIESVNITRGTSNLAFSKTGHPNAIDVDISVLNLDETISVDVASGGIIANDIRRFRQLMRRTPFTDYMNTITGLDVYHQIYRLPRLRLALAENMLRLNKYINPDPAALAAFTVDKIPFHNEIFRPILRNNVNAITDMTRGF